MRSSTILIAAACCLAAACTPDRPAVPNEADANAQATDGTVDGGGAAATEADESSAVKMAVAPEADAAKCPIMSDGEWKAGIATTIDGDRILGVAGVITVNTGGYDVKLVPGPLDKMNPPNQHFTLEVKQPTGMVIQVVTRHPVHATAPGQPRYASVVISCRGQEIERITNIIGQE